MSQRRFTTLCSRLRRISKFAGRAASAGYSYCRRGSAALNVWGRKALALAALQMRRIGEAAGRRLKQWQTSLCSPVPGGYRYYRHSLPLRVMHWSNVLFLALLLMSGLNIFNAHPALYWGNSSYRGVPPILEIEGTENDQGEISGVTRVFGHDFNTTGFLGASKDAAGQWTSRGFPSWLTIPDNRWLSLARRWHFFIAWLLVINGIAFVIYSIAGRHLHNDLAPTRQDWRSIGRSVIDHLRFRNPTGEAAKHYNI
jgi:hypothetical protein